VQQRGELAFGSVEFVVVHKVIMVRPLRRSGRGLARRLFR
jgi:hypothetical protein